MTRITKRDVSRQFARVADAAEELGLSAWRGWELHEGSPSTGTSWSLITGRYGSSDIVGLPPFDHIGRTAKEAERFLAGMAAAFESVAHAKRREA